MRIAAMRRALTRSDERGSIPLAMLLTLVAVSLSATMVPTVMSQMKSTRFSVARVHSLHAAQAGLDVAMGHIRAAQDATGKGLLSELPCGTIAGNVGSGPARYSVTVDYFKEDPRGHDDSWIAANRIRCVVGGGAASTPAYALLRATGVEEPGDTGRSLRATYTFQTSNQNIAGGLIHVYKTSTSLDLCLDAGSGSPIAGTSVRMRLCTAGGLQQKFSYNSNLTITLVASQTAAMPLGMCLDAGTPQSVGRVVQFQPCSATTRPQQQWSFNDSANFEGTSDGVTLNGFCFNVQNVNTPGSLVILGSAGNGTCRSSYNNLQNWSPDPAAGAGAAGKGSGQIVNFKQFGRCIDVTEQNVNYSYLIVWPCKQAPDASRVRWNQKFTLPTVNATTHIGTGRIATLHDNGTRYCLRSPGSTASGQYVTITACPATTPANMTWLVHEDTGVYATSYIIKDSYGNCLTPTDPDATSPDLYPNGLKISKIVVRACNGSTLQKWNAPPNILQSTPLKDVGEK